jgi:hypothetical protein
MVIRLPSCPLSRPAERATRTPSHRSRLHSWLGVHEGADLAPSFVHQATAGREGAEAQ